MSTQVRAELPAASDHVPPIGWAQIVVLVATIARLALIAFPPHGYDSFAYKHWTWRLVHEPISQFYIDDGQAFPDHLPGDLWLFKLLGTATQFFNPDIDFYGVLYGGLTSLLAISFDALIVYVLVRVGRFVGNAQAGRVAAIAYWLAPAPIFVASVWGQIDGVSTALVVVALGLAISSRFSLAFLALTAGALVKPQFAVLALPLIIGWWRASGLDTGRWIVRVFATGLGCVGLLAGASAPFGVSLVGEWGRWSLLERIQLASDTYTVSTLGAHNFWILFDPISWPPDDREPWLFGISRYEVGMAMFTVVLVYVIWVMFARWHGPITMVFVSNVLMFGFFLFMTRMHERYLFPVVALSILLAMMDRRYLRYAIAVNILVFANIGLRFIWPLNNEGPAWRYIAGLGWLEHAWFVQFLAISTMFVFAWLSIEGASRRKP